MCCGRRRITGRRLRLRWRRLRLRLRLGCLGWAVAVVGSGGDAVSWIAMTDARYADAAELYAEIGSRPLEAAAYFSAARQAVTNAKSDQAPDYAERALSFYRSVGATTYIHDAEELIDRARSA
jgi:hypothetical protein